MAKPAILCLLATLSLFSGCLGEGSPAVESPPSEGVAETHPAEMEAAPAPAPVPPKCPKNHSNNYGTALTIAGEYVWTGVGGNVVVYYRESNGCSGIQIEEDWAHNPDTKVAEVPYPLAAVAGQDEAAGGEEPPRCPVNDRGNHGTWTQVEDHYIVSPYGGFLAVVYEESNGCTGMQTEDEWPHNPDTKVAEVPYPIDAAAPLSAKA